MTLESYTNSCLSCFRRCPREFDLRYIKKLERAGEDREVLRVGTTWHKAHDVFEKTARATCPADPWAVRGETNVNHAAYAAIAKHAPGAVWNMKLSRLFAAYRWKWEAHPLKVLGTEITFEYETFGTKKRGQIDAIVEIDGRVGNVERKTSSEDLSDGSPFWQRQRMGTQVSGYEIAFKEAMGTPPAFTLYDVVRKPTIRPKSITKKDMVRLRKDLDKHGLSEYYGEPISAEDTEAALIEGRETLPLFGARLTSDIGDRPDWYFQRKPIWRTAKDLDDAARDTRQTIEMIEILSNEEPNVDDMDAFDSSLFPRNPDACATFGLCDFFELCSNGEYPHDALPSGFQFRRHLHPELHDEEIAV